jgi:hypothetical protein
MREQQVASTVVVAGTTHRTVGGQTYRLTSIVLNPSYNPNTFVNDISLLQTSTDVLYSNMVQPATIGSAYIGVDVPLLAMGWGATVSGGSGSQNLLFIRTTTISNTDCFARFDAEERGNRIEASSLCTFTSQE